MLNCSVMSDSLLSHGLQPTRLLHHQLPELAQTHVHCISDAIQPSHPLSPPSPPAFNLSQHQGLFQLVSSSTIRWPKYWSFSFSISPSNEYSFRTDWLDLLAVQGTLKSLLQPHSSKGSILQCFLSKFNMAYFCLFHECHTFFLRALQMFFRQNPRFFKNSFGCFTDYMFCLFVVMCLKPN